MIRLLQRLRIGTIAFVATMLAVAPIDTRGESAVFQSFDGPEVSWKLLDERAGVQIVAHGCVKNDARQGTGSERLVINAPVGDSVRFLCPVGRAPILDELEIGLWIKADQPGVAVAAHVVMPRSTDAKTGGPQSVVVTGPLYNQVGRWQQLILSGIPRLVAEQVRVFRATPGANVDPREAYVDAVVLVVPSGVGNTTVLTDGLSVDGIVVQAAAEMPTTSGQPSMQGWRSDRVATAAAPAQRAQPALERQGNMLTIGGRPFFARGIRWHDERLDFLAARGFNAIWTDELPTAEEMTQATKLNLWFVCPPPRPDTIAQDGLPIALDRVLAWNLGTPQGRHDLEYFRRWAELVRERDPVDGRPIVVAPAADWWPCSKIGDVLMAAHAASGRMTETDFGTWLRGLPRLAQPETPFWAEVPTQLGECVRHQIATLTAKAAPPTMLDESQLELLVHTAAMSGVRGILFDSETPLDAADDVTTHRALAVEAMNRELQLIEPWLTNGKTVGQATAVDSPTTAMVLQVDRARLVVPATWIARAPNSSSATTAIIVPGVPESNEAFAMSPAGLRTLMSKRVAGGVRVALDGDSDTLILLTEDPGVVNNFRQRFARDGHRAVQLERDLTSAGAKSLVGTARRLEQFGSGSRDALQAVGIANSEMARCNTALAAGKLDEAYQRAAAGRRAIAAAAERQRSAAGAMPLTSTPYGPESNTVADQLELQRSLATLRGGENLLEGGELEDLAGLQQLGWQHVTDALAGIDSRAELSPREPHSGRYSLELSAKPQAADGAPQIIARPLVWITTPPVRATSDQLLEISGWVRVVEPIKGSIDGLQIVDSLGGPEMGLRLTSSPGWQQFRLIRGASETLDVTVTFALAGLGSATIDDVAIRALTRPTAKRLPPVTNAPPQTPQQSPPSSQPPVSMPPEAAQLQGPLFTAPLPR